MLPTLPTHLDSDSISAASIDQNTLSLSRILLAIETKPFWLRFGYGKEAREAPAREAGATLHCEATLS